MKRFFLFFLFCITAIFCWNFYLNNKYHIKAAEKNTQQLDVSKRFEPKFRKDGLDDIVLITMIKDEDDIIYENLVWHFSVGFRKFVIIDNNSTDKSLEKIKKFEKETKDHANVIIISDPIAGYIQSKKMTGAFLFARSIWPDLKWIFPVDADEFWLPETDLSELLESVPSYIDAILTNGPKYLPVKEQDYEGLEPFYSKLSKREKMVYSNKVKVAFRNNNEFYIAQGNHSIETNYPKFLSKTLKIIGVPRYQAINLHGLHMVEFPIRSIAHSKKKFENGMRANLIAQEKGLISSQQGTHWSDYKQIKEKFGEDAPRVKFESYMIDENNTIEDKLNFDNAYTNYIEILSHNNL